jgi:hypothetical protein
MIRGLDFTSEIDVHIAEMVMQKTAKDFYINIISMKHMPKVNYNNSACGQCFYKRPKMLAMQRMFRSEVPKISHNATGPFPAATTTRIIQ